MIHTPLFLAARAAARLGLVLMACLLGLVGSAVAQTTGPSGLPLPRFVSLAGDTINVRTGPGRHYPIRWVYARVGLPVKIVEEADTWRKIEDQDGDQGWVHGSLLSKRRTVMSLQRVRSLRRTPTQDSRVLLRVEPGVIGRLLDCNSEWCFLEIDGRRGWMERSGLWGLLSDEMRR